MEEYKSIDQYEAWELELLFGIPLLPLSNINDSYCKERAFQLSYLEKKSRGRRFRNQILKRIGTPILIIGLFLTWVFTDELAIAIIAGLIICTLIFFASRALENQEKKKDNKVIAASDERHRQVRIENSKLLTDEFKAVVPQRYWSYEAMNTMYTLIKEHRASNWREVCNLYDTIEHRKNLEAQSEARTKMVRRTMQNSEQAVALANQAKQAAEAAVDISLIDAM